MEIPDNLRKFVKDTIERAKTTEFPSRDPFRAFGFDSDPFTTPVNLEEISYLVENGILDNNMGKTITLITDILNSQDQGKQLNGALIGYRHNGVSTLVNSAFLLMKNEVSSLDSAIRIDAKEMVLFEDYQYNATKSIQNFRNRIAEKDIEQNLPLIIIDHADYIVDFFISFQESMKYTFPETSILYIFSYSAWSRLRSYVTYSGYTDEFYNTLLPAIELDPLDTRDIYEILKIKLSKNNILQQPFTDDVLEAISETSNNSLKNAIKLCRTLCKECFYRGNDRAHIEMVLDLASLLEFNIRSKFEDMVLDEEGTRVFLLTLISMKSIAFDLGISYDELELNLNLQKTTISYHLSQLMKDKIVSKKTVDRKAYYSLNESLVSLSDLYLITEFNKKDRFVKLESFSDGF